MIKSLQLLVSFMLAIFSCLAVGTETPDYPGAKLSTDNYENRVSLSDRTLNLTLDEAVYLGIRQNRDIRSAYLGRVSDKFSLKVIQNQYDPQVSLSGRFNSSQNQDDNYQDGSVIPETIWQTQYGTRLSLAWANQLNYSEQVGSSRSDGISFNVSQPLLQGAGYSVASAPLQIAEISEEINKLNLKALVSDVITSIVLTYREMLQAQEQLQISKQALERSKQLLRVNQELIKAGRMAEFDSLQTEANIANQELEIIQAENQLQNTRLDLLRLLAVDLDTNLILSSSLDAQATDIRLADALDIARASQPEYLSELFAKQIAEINLIVAENQALPDVSLVGGYSQVRDRYSGGSGRSWESYVGVQVDIPVGPNLGNRQSGVDARVAIEQQKLRISEADQALQRDVTQAIRNLETQWRQVQIAERALELSSRAVEVEREKLQAGRSSNFQVLSFEDDLRNAENTRLDALLAYLNSQTTLNQILGTTLESWEIKINE